MKHLKGIIIFICTLVAFGAFGKSKADSLEHALRNTEDTLEIKTLNLLAFEFSKSGAFEKGMLVAQRALQLSQKLKFRKGEAGAYSNMGSLYSSQAEYPKALKNYLAALKVAEQAGNKKQIVACYNNIGILYQKQKEYAKALEYHLKSLRIKEEIKDKRGIASSLTNIGNVYNMQHQYDEALRYYQRAMSLARELKIESLVTSNLNNMGYVFLSKKEYPKSAELFTEALTRAREADDKSNVLMAMINLGDISRLEGMKRSGAEQRRRFAESESYLRKALDIALQMGDLSFIRDSYGSLASLYNNRHDPKHALEYQKLFVAYRDSMFNETNTKASLSAEMNYEYEKKEALAKIEQEKKEAIAQSEREKEKQRNFIILTAVIAGLSLSGGFVIFMLRAYHQKKKVNLLIQEQKAEVEFQKDLIENKQKEILDSIRYAKRIQTALLPPEKYIERALSKYGK